MSNPFPWLGGGIGFVFYARPKPGSGTADGGRPSRIDRLISDYDQGADDSSLKRKQFPANNVVRGKGNAS